MSIPIETFLFVKVAHRHHCKTLLVPLGSDILRASRFKNHLQRIAFNETDFVAADNRLPFSRQLVSSFSIPDFKCRPLGFGSDAITSIIETKGKYDKAHLQAQLGLPRSGYNIVCGYNAALSQRHDVMIESLIKVAKYLPKDYLIIVPLTYGLDKEKILERLKSIYSGASLNIFFLTEYMTPQQVTYLRLITDLFIHIQTTDAYNASLQEFMLAGAQCVNGSWLRYERLEKHGKVFHTIDSPEALTGFLEDWFTGKVQNIELSKECEQEICQGKEWGVVLSYWKSFFDEQ